MKVALQNLRQKFLAQHNRSRLKRGLDGVWDRTPVFFIFTPEIVHLAPYCTQNIDRSRFAPVMITNAVPSDDVAWIRSVNSELPLIELKNSLRKNSASLVSHGDVLNDLFSVAKGHFCIQDPDCFVVEESFWGGVDVGANEFASGAFWEHLEKHNHVLPHTFFLMFNLDSFRDIQNRFSIDAGVIRKLPTAAANHVRSLGYTPGIYPHSFKDYFDTLQAYWVLSLSDQQIFRELPGERKSIFHIGGTSYLHKSDIDLAHWDYWPLSVHYFNLRVLELPLGERFRGRHREITERYTSAAGLLASNSEFSNGWRRAEIDLIMDKVTEG